MSIPPRQYVRHADYRNTTIFFANMAEVRSILFRVYSCLNFDSSVATSRRARSLKSSWALSGISTFIDTGTSSGVCGRISLVLLVSRTLGISVKGIYTNVV